MPFLTDAERVQLAAVLDVVLPAGDGIPGAGEAGGADYVEQLLSAFDHDPPRIWCGGPFSGRAGGEASFGDWLPLGRLEEQAWRQRIGAWQDAYRSGLAALGDDFADVTREEQVARVGTDAAFADLLHEHAAEALYGAPEYGGNRDLAGWTAIGFAGDVQPRGWTDAETTAP